MFTRLRPIAGRRSSHAGWARWLVGVQVAVAAVYTVTVLVLPLQWPASLDAEGAFDFVPKWAALLFYAATVAGGLAIFFARRGKRR